MEGEGLETSRRTPSPRHPGARNAAWVRVVGGADRGWLDAAVRAWLIATLPSLALFLLRVRLGWITPAPASGMPGVRVVLYASVGAPVLETALMMVVAWPLARVLRHSLPRIVALAALAALAHLPGGGASQALIALWPFLVYATVLFAWYERSGAAAFAMTALVHALYNATFLATGFAMVATLE